MTTMTWTDEVGYRDPYDEWETHSCRITFCTFCDMATFPSDTATSHKHPMEDNCNAPRKNIPMAVDVSLNKVKR
jgi:hypothetical protein